MVRVGAVLCLLGRFDAADAAGRKRADSRGRQNARQHHRDGVGRMTEEEHQALHQNDLDEHEAETERREVEQIAPLSGSRHAVLGEAPKRQDDQRRRQDGDLDE